MYCFGIWEIVLSSFFYPSALFNNWYFQKSQFCKLFAVSQAIMTARSGEPVTSCVRIELKHTSAVVWMDTSWSKITSAKPMCQVPLSCVVTIICSLSQTDARVCSFLNVRQSILFLVFKGGDWSFKWIFNRKCKLHHCVSGGLPQLIFTNGGDLMMADIHGRFVRTLVPSQGKGNAVGVSYLFKSNIIFWSDTHNEKVGQ